jgi:16S rRNA C1402 (ribose-2'-O) methylase RsmI
MKKRVFVCTESLSVDSSIIGSSVKKVVKKLNDIQTMYQKKFGDSVTLVFDDILEYNDGSYCDNYIIARELVIRIERDETDKETEDRIAAEVVAKQQKKAAKALAKQQKLASEKELYESLKKKFG